MDLPGYSGPLELLLKLIRKNEVDIYDIPISSITEQYLEEVQEIQRRDLVIAGDFVLMAATLLEIKSAMMLPRPVALDADDDAGDPRADLVQRLLEYQAVQAAAEELGQLEGQRRLVHCRPFVPAVMQQFGPFYPPAPNLSLAGLMRSLTAMLDRLAESEEQVTSVPRQTVSLRLRIAEVVADLTLAARTGLLFEELARPAEGRIFVIVTFLAILETLRSGRIVVRDCPEGTYRFWLARFLKK